MSGLGPGGFTPAQQADILSAIQGDEASLIDAALNFSPTQPLGQLNGIKAANISTMWAVCAAAYQGIDPANAVGVQLDNICALTGVTRNPATKTLVLCNCTLAAGTYAAGTLMANISGYPQYTFSNRDVVTSAGGLVTGIYFQATQTGPIAANAGTLTVITTPVTGWTSITNPASGTVGSLVETDAALRLRRAQTIVAAGGTTVDSLRTALLEVPQVIAAFIIENTTDAPDQYGQPPHSIEAIVYDGGGLANSAAIAQAIWNGRASGIRAYGSTSGQAVDALGRPQTVPFTRVTQQSIYVAITVKTNPLTFQGGGVGAAAVANAMAALQTTPTPEGYMFVPGGCVFADQLRLAALSVPGVLAVPSVALDTNPSPVASADIAMPSTYLATLAPGNVGVTVT